MRTIVFMGILGKRFGKRFRLAVNSPQEATHALACQMPALRKFLLNAERQGMRFAVLVGKNRREVGEAEINHTLPDDDNIIRIVPVVMGAGGKTLAYLQIVAGVVLAGVGVITGNWGVAAAGVGMIIGGVASLYAMNSTLGVNNEDGNRANKGFGGAVTTVAQGNPVPILYGRRDIGGFVCSGQIRTVSS